MPLQNDHAWQMAMATRRPPQYRRNIIALVERISSIALLSGDVIQYRRQHDTRLWPNWQRRRQRRIWI